jgi:aldo/keto reductase family protein
VGSIELRWRKPFARPPLACENMSPAYASNFFAN